MTGADVVSAAMDLLKVPFRHQGRNKLGVDCAGVLVHCFQALGLPHFDTQGYPRTPYDGTLEKILDAQPSLKRIPVSEAREGDVLVMRIRKEPQHIAIHAGMHHGAAYIIHSSEQYGVVVMHRADELWRARVIRAYRMERPA
ncbi:C40 family peptidase [Pseudomonas sp. S9]|uniref:C40 family peptidase n=1 Tax=Pseudomonas sp. S9 TaxID=686578 RepID=UPI0002556F59|nr:NlpC/P60 family protein [Pseudomonas sp. S9]